jgi:hypothetical protein
MATEKDETKKAKPAAKPAKAAAAAKPAAAAASADKPAAKPAKAAKASSKATPAAADGPACRVAGCKQAVRAKGFCRKHFIGWRRGAVGDHHRYKVCSKEGCRKPRARAGFCAEHAGIGAPAAAAPAPGGEGGATA